MHVRGSTAPAVEVAASWRRRAASGLMWNGSDWCVTGPAAGEAAMASAVPPIDDEDCPRVLPGGDSD